MPVSIGDSYGTCRQGWLALVRYEGRLAFPFIRFISQSGARTASTMTENTSETNGCGLSFSPPPRRSAKVLHALYFLRWSFAASASNLAVWSVITRLERERRLSP